MKRDGIEPCSCEARQIAAAMGRNGYVTIIKAKVNCAGTECIFAVETTRPKAPMAVLDDIRAACVEYAASADGVATLGGNRMDWKDFAIHLPENIAQRNGFCKVRTCGTIERPLDENIIAPGDWQEQPTTDSRFLRWLRTIRKAFP